MAITIQLADTSPSTDDGIGSTIDFSVISRINDEVIPKSFDICAFEKIYIEPVFAEVGSIVDGYKNDETDLLFGLSRESDTVEIKLFKNDIFITTITDNTLGSYFTQSLFTGTTKAVGFLVNWNLVLAAHGVGLYHFTADRIILTQNSNLESHKYNLKVFDEQLADDTIVFKTVQNGFIEGGFDYTSFEWRGSIRIQGFFKVEDYEFITENYMTTDREIEQIQDKIKTIYTMIVRLAPSSVMINFIKDRLLANEMTVIGYGIFEFLERYREIPISAEGISESKFYERNSKGSFTFAFTDRVQTPIKRRFI